MCCGTHSSGFACHNTSQHWHVEENTSYTVLMQWKHPSPSFLHHTDTPSSQLCHNLTDINFRTPSSLPLLWQHPDLQSVAMETPTSYPVTMEETSTPYSATPPPALLLIIWIYPPFLCGRTCRPTHHRQLWRCAPAPPSPVGGGHASGSAGSRWLLQTGGREEGQSVTFSQLVIVFTTTGTMQPQILHNTYIKHGHTIGSGHTCPHSSLRKWHWVWLHPSMYVPIPA